MQSLQPSPTLKRILKPIYGPPRTAIQSFRARRINRAYDEQYADARAAYGKESQPAHLGVADSNQVGVRFLNGPKSEGLVKSKVLSA